MSHSGCALVWHVQPRVVIFPCHTHYCPSCPSSVNWLHPAARSPPHESSQPTDQYRGTKRPSGGTRRSHSATGGYCRGASDPRRRRRRFIIVGCMPGVRAFRWAVWQQQNGRQLHAGSAAQRTVRACALHCTAGTQPHSLLVLQHLPVTAHTPTHLNTQSATHCHCSPHSMRSTVYVTVRGPSVCLSVPARKEEQLWYCPVAGNRAAASN